MITRITILQHYAFGIGCDMCTCQQLLFSLEKSLTLITWSTVWDGSLPSLPTSSGSNSSQKRFMNVYLTLSYTTMDNLQSLTCSRYLGKNYWIISLDFYPLHLSPAKFTIISKKKKILEIQSNSILLQTVCFAFQDSFFSPSQPLFSTQCVLSSASIRAQTLLRSGGI